MMTDLMLMVSISAGLEASSAGREYGDLHSLNEAYGVLAEEMDEVDEEITRMRDEFSVLLRMIRNTDDLVDTITNIHSHAKMAACECIQVAAVAERFLDMINKEE